MGAGVPSNQTTLRDNGIRNLSRPVIIWWRAATYRLTRRGRQCYGHCPLFTHPGAAVAFKVGDAKACAGVVAGGPSVTVAPMLMAVGSTDMVGATGDTYVPPVAESPEPPARFCGCGAPGCVNTSTAAVMSAPPPSPADSRVSCFVRIDYP